MNVLDHLVEEHRRAEELTQSLIDSQPGQQRRAALDRLERSLTMHMAVEERYVYPLVQQYLGPTTEAGAANEHHLTRQALHQMRTLADREGFAAAAEALKAGLTRHVNEEEHDIFPQLRERAPGRVDALADPAQLMRAIRSDGPTDDIIARLARDPEGAHLSPDEQEAIARELR